MDSNPNEQDSYFPNVRVTNSSPRSRIPESSNSPTPNRNPHPFPPNFYNPYFPQNPAFFSQNPYVPQGSNPSYPMQHPNMYMNMPPFQMMPQTGMFTPDMSNFDGTSVPVAQSPKTPTSQNLGSNDPEEDEVAVEENYDAARTVWSFEEDTLLISAWLNVSKDSITGNEQNRKTFWKRISDYCQEHQPGLIRRNSDAMQRHFSTLNKLIAAYAACWEKTCARQVSGFSESNYIEETQKTFKMMYPTCKVDIRKRWLLLANEEKWKCHNKQTDGSKRNKTTHTGVFSSSSHTESVQPDNIDFNTCIRPEGVKAAKRKSKKKAVTQDSQYSEELDSLKKLEEKKLEHVKMWSQAIERQTTMREKELEQKQKEMEQKQMEMEQKIMFADTSQMSEAQKDFHEVQLQRLLRKARREEDM